MQNMDKQRKMCFRKSGTSFLTTRLPYNLHNESNGYDVGS